MAIVEIDASKAWNNLYADFNKHSWPSSGRKGFYPYAKADFFPSFQMERGAKVFTIGSCFARHIEDRLAAHGFDVVPKRYFGNDHRINKYNCYSMAEDIKYVLNIRRLTTEQRFVKVADDGWMDLHLHSIKAQSWEACIGDMYQSLAMYQQIEDCPYFVITLGMSEVWFDRETESYVNQPINFIKYHQSCEQTRKMFAERFVFKVLDYNECCNGLRDLIGLLRQASPQCKIMLIVSPVPFGATFTEGGVIAANSYSKSVLRCAAEQIRIELPFVDYFSAYEIITHSPRENTWENDNAHVRAEAMDFCVKIMLVV